MSRCVCPVHPCDCARRRPSHEPPSVTAVAAGPRDHALRGAQDRLGPRLRRGTPRPPGAGLIPPDRWEPRGRPDPGESLPLDADADAREPDCSTPSRLAARRIAAISSAATMSSAVRRRLPTGCSGPEGPSKRYWSAAVTSGATRARARRHFRMSPGGSTPYFSRRTPELPPLSAAVTTAVTRQCGRRWRRRPISTHGQPGPAPQGHDVRKPPLAPPTESGEQLGPIQAEGGIQLDRVTQPRPPDPTEAIAFLVDHYKVGITPPSRSWRGSGADPRRVPAGLPGGRQGAGAAARPAAAGPVKDGRDGLMTTSALAPIPPSPSVTTATMIPSRAFTSSILLAIFS
jgi:hypothetical protein